MDIKTHILRTTSRLEKYISILHNLSSEAIKHTTDKIPVKDVDIVLYDTMENAEGITRIYGYTPHAHLVFIYLNPAAENFSHAIESDLEKSIAHELHHALRWRNPGYGTTLLEAMVTEGLAEHFADEIKKGDEPWNHALSEKEMKKFSSLAKKNYHETYDHNEWFFGTNKKIPYYTGYTLGYSLVGNYLKQHQTEKASTLFSASARIFE